MGTLGLARFVVTTVIGIGVLAATVVGLFDALQRPDWAFSEEGKRTKKFWLIALGAGALFGLLGALRMISVVMNLIALVPVAAYWYDVRPEVKRYGTTRGGRAKTRVSKREMRREVKAFRRELSEH